MDIRANQNMILDGKLVTSWEEMAKVYRRRLEIHGTGHETFFYVSEATHAAKLAHHSRLLHALIQPTDAVLDVGCGIGALVPFIPPCQYRGIDLVREFLNEAQRLYPDLQFDCLNITDVTEYYDWVILAGITGTAPMPEVIIQKAWELARKGIIVDFIDARKYQGQDVNTYHMGVCTEFFLDMGAKRVELYPTRNLWNVYIVHKQSLWL
jgi:2-polyprenyl-3-methyl-5-hydroxy-6-metoxy-1,4-benzoquinol methylase